MSALSSPIEQKPTGTTASASAESQTVFSSTPDPTHILLSRLDSWKHAVSIIEDYVEAHLSSQKHTTSDLEKIKKSIADEPKFDYNTTPVEPPSSPSIDKRSSFSPSAAGDTVGEAGNGAPGGIAEAFREMRTRNDLLLNKSIETEALLKSILPQLTTAKGDIEKHQKGLKGSGLKLSKDVEKARHATQKQLEELGSSISTFSVSTGSKVDYKRDPYVSNRHVLSRLDSQVILENAQSESVLSAQNTFQSLELHIVHVIQQATKVTAEVLNGYNELSSASYTPIASAFGNIPEDYEWGQFVTRNNDSLVPTTLDKREVSRVDFPGIHHESSKPIIEGILQRKEGKVIKTYNTSYYVLSASGILFAFKSQDPVVDPDPDFALVLKDCSVGPVSARETGKNKFKINGKDLTSNLPRKKEFSFKFSTYDEMLAWHEAIIQASGIEATTTSPDSESVLSSPTSPIDSRAATFEQPSSGLAEEPPTRVVTEQVASPIAETPVAVAEPVEPKTVAEVTPRSEVEPLKIVETSPDASLDAKVHAAQLQKQDGV